MHNKFSYVALFVLLSALLFTPLLSFAETDDEKSVKTVIELLKSDKIDDAVKEANAIKDESLKKKMSDQITAVKNVKAHFYAGETDKALTAADAIKDDGLKQKMLVEIVDELVKSHKTDEAVKAAEAINDKDLKQKKMGEIADADVKQFWKGWGVGLISNFAIGHKKPVKTAIIAANNIVRVEEEEDVKYGLGLEFHKFLFSTSWKYAKTDLWTWALAFGPYVSVFPGNNNIIDSIGVGFVFGFIGGRKQNDAKPSDRNKLSLNIGIGGYVDPSTQVLADGFEDNTALPSGETSVRFKKVTQYGVQGVLSFNYEF